jgi:2'-5' RNA ligase
VYALDLALDPPADALIAAAWQRLAEAGYQTPDNQGFRPHLTLGLYSHTNETVCKAVMEVAVATLEAELELRFTGPKLFYTDPGVLFLGVEASPELMAFQAAIQDQVLRHSTVENPHYAPDVWVPHVTLADQIDAMKLRSALALAGKCSLPLVARPTSMRLLMLRPRQVLYVREMAQPTA